MIITDKAYLRADGRKGIRNHIVVAYLVECAHHVAREIVYPYRDRGAHLIGFGGCYPNDYAARMMRTLCTHPNVGGVILLSLGCESFNRNALREAIVASGRPVETLVIQQTGGTRKTIEQGRKLMEDMLPNVAQVPRAPLHIDEFIVGTVCGGSDATSGNAEGGLSTIEEKSMGAYAKSGASRISGLLKPGDIPPRGGLYLLDVVPDGEVRFGFPNINDNAEIAELIACGSHVVLFSTGRGSVVGSAISPVIKVCANPETYRRMSEDMDVDAGKILEGRASLDEVGREILDLSLAVARGAQTKSEELGHQEFVLTYKSFEPIGPSCLPIA
jgi:altronate dehydratase